MAVAPIAKPISARRSIGSGSARCRGEAGCSRSTLKPSAETMKVASRPASIRYSGQCRRRASTARMPASMPGARPRVTGSDGLPSVRREQHLDLGALAFAPLPHADRPTVAAHDPEGGREAQAAPSVLRGEERVEESPARGIGHARPGVADPHEDVETGPELGGALRLGEQRGVDVAPPGP